jgi:hypothetical protein
LVMVSAADTTTVTVYTTTAHMTLNVEQWSENNCRHSLGSDFESQITNLLVLGHQREPSVSQMVGSNKHINSW